MGTLLKDISNLICCKISECYSNDSFLIARNSNSGFYKIQEYTIFKEIIVLSILGDTTVILKPDRIVYRHKRLLESLESDPKTDLSAFGIAEAEMLNKAEKKENRSQKLLNILGSSDFEDDIIALKY